MLHWNIEFWILKFKSGQGYYYYCYCGWVDRPPGHCMAQCQLVQVNCWAAVRVIKTRCVGRRSPSLLLLCGVSCVLGVHVCVSRYVITESILYYLLLHFFLFGSGASSSRSVAVLGATVSQRERAVRVGACWVLTLLVLHLFSWRPGVFWSSATTTRLLLSWLGSGWTGSLHVAAASGPVWRHHAIISVEATKSSLSQAEFGSPVSLGFNYFPLLISIFVYLIQVILNLVFGC